MKTHSPVRSNLARVPGATSMVRALRPGLRWPQLKTFTGYIQPRPTDIDGALGQVDVAGLERGGLSESSTTGHKELDERLPVLTDAGMQQSKLFVGQENHFRWCVAAQPVAIARVGRDVLGPDCSVEGTGQEAMFVGRGLGGAGQAVEPLGRIGVGQCRQWQGPDLPGGAMSLALARRYRIRVASLTPVKWSNMVGAPAGHREAIGSGRLDCPDFQRLGWACFVSQLLGTSRPRHGH